MAKFLLLRRNWAHRKTQTKRRERTIAQLVRRKEAVGAHFNFSATLAPVQQNEHTAFMQASPYHAMWNKTIMQELVGTRDSSDPTKCLGHEHL